ncbi:hypothetical protein [Lachnotalea glycerini]|nr:hypothetical protein [Lachnotalea glycerini]
MYASLDLQQLVFQYSNGDIYANGQFVLNVNKTSELVWSREFNLNYPGGGYHHRTHRISSVKVKKIDPRPIRYTSNYASSDYAIIIYLDEGTLFTYADMVYINGGPLISNFADTSGQITPRFLGSFDFTSGDHSLIFDIATQRVIDFYSGLNYYYYSHVEEANIAFIQ